MRLAVAVEADAIGGEARQVDHGRSHAIPGEPVECPHEHHVEFPSRGIGEQFAELLSLVDTLGAALVVDIFVHHHVPDAVAPCAKLHELVLGVVALVVGRDPCVDRDPVCRSGSHETIVWCPFSLRRNRLIFQWPKQHVLRTRFVSISTPTNDGAVFPCAIAITYLFSRAPCALRNRGQDEITLGEPGSAVMSTGVLTSASMA